MKNILKIFGVLMFTITAYSQVNVSISGMTYISGTPISNCGNIDFGTNATVRIQFGITLTKPQSQAVGVGNLYVYTISSGTYRFERKNEIIQPASFDTYYSTSADITMNSSDFNTTGGTLFAVFKSSGGVEYQTSCSYTITKTNSPTFSLSPSSLSIACGDTSARTFTVTPANIPTGSTLIYNWSFSGWNGSSNTNSIILTPTSGTNSLSNVSVTPVLNGVAQSARTCTISRPAFSSTAVITGPTGICTGTAVYAISNTAGQTVAWNLSNPSIGNLTNQSNTGVTVALTGNGAQTLSASISNPCGQTTTKTYIINDGAPTFTSNATITGSSSSCSSSGVYTISNILAGQNVSWNLSDLSIGFLNGSTNTQTTVNITGSGAQILTAVISNSCGQTATKNFQIYGGVPTLSSFTCGSGAPFCSGTVCICDSCLPSFDVSSLVIANMNGQTTAEAGLASNWVLQKLNNNIQITSNTGKKTYIAANVLGATGVQVKARNSCGWSQWYTLNFDVVSCARIANINSNVYTISPNPSRNIVNIELLDKKNIPEKEAIISGELFDLLGISKSKVEIKNNKATFSVAGLIRGVYILKISINDKVESHQIVVE